MGKYDDLKLKQLQEKLREKGAKLYGRRIELIQRYVLRFTCKQTGSVNHVVNLGGISATRVAEKLC